jgi:hypothetical protein
LPPDAVVIALGKLAQAVATNQADRRRTIAGGFLLGERDDGWG